VFEMREERYNVKVIEIDMKNKCVTFKQFSRFNYDLNPK